jgi:hypothetical protein
MLPRRPPRCQCQTRSKEDRGRTMVILLAGTRSTDVHDYMILHDTHFED